MIPAPSWMPTGMSWWAAVLWTLLEIAIFFGVPLGLVALSSPMQHLAQRIKATWTRQRVGSKARRNLPMKKWR